MVRQNNSKPFDASGHLHDKGTDRLLADIAASPGPSDLTDAEFAELKRAVASGSDTILRLQTEVLIAGRVRRETAKVYAEWSASIDRIEAGFKQRVASIVGTPRLPMGEPAPLPLVSLGPSGMGGDAQAETCDKCGGAWGEWDADHTIDGYPNGRQIRFCSGCDRAESRDPKARECNHGN